jgi:hypothetical protein
MTRNGGKSFGVGGAGATVVPVVAPGDWSFGVAGSAVIRAMSSIAFLYPSIEYNRAADD